MRVPRVIAKGESIMSLAVLRRAVGVAILVPIGSGVTAKYAASNADSLASSTVVSQSSPYARCSSGGAVDGSGVDTENTRYLNTAVEPYLAVDPRTVGTSHLNLIGVWQQDRWSSGGAQGIVAGSSFDGGKTWGESSLPFAVCASHRSPFVRASDPWVSIGPDGTAYASALGINSTANAVLAATSVDGGRTWGRARAVVADSTSRFQNDKESITANPVRRGVAYVTWNRTRQPIATHQMCTWFAETTDSGRSWSTPRQIVPARPGADTFEHQIVVDPRTGVLYDIFTVEGGHGESDEALGEQSPGRPLATRGGNLAGTSLAFVTSRDAGVTWSTPRFIAWVHKVDPLVSMQYRLGNPGPTVAIDQVSGTLYVAWTDTQRFHSECPDIALTRSDDGGATWSTPLHITGSGRRPAFTPAIATNAQGVVGLSFYSANELYAALTDVDPSPPRVQFDAWFVSSRDDGKHFGFMLRLGRPSDYRRAPFSNGYFLGDYQGLAAAGREFHPFFVMTNSGYAEIRTNVLTTTVTPYAVSE